MSAPFTPGPWQWVGDDEIEQAEHPFTSVAEVVRIHGDERNANARLIAAAPELYEALAALCDYLAMHPPHDGPLVTAGRAVLAKARGGQ